LADHGLALFGPHPAPQDDRILADGSESSVELIIPPEIVHPFRSKSSTHSD